MGFIFLVASVSMWFSMRSLSERGVPSNVSISKRVIFSLSSWYNSSVTPNPMPVLNLSP